MIAVDNGRHGQDDAVRIVDDRVDGAVLDDGQISFQVAVSLEVWNKRVGANVIVYWPKVRIWAAEQQLQELRCVSNFSSSPNNSKPNFKSTWHLFERGYQTYRDSGESNRDYKTKGRV